jgi:hypothetical protein
MVEGELSTPRDTHAGVPQGTILGPILYILYINDTPQTPRVYLALFSNDTCVYTTDREEVMFSGNFNAVSSQWSCGVSAAT